MGTYSIYRSTSCGFMVPTDVKYVTYITVGGGGGGAYPNISGLPRPGFTAPGSGTGTSISPGSVSSGGGGAGSLYSGGSGGWGSWRSGSRGGYSFGPSSRAPSGYGGLGQGGAGQWRSGSQSYGGGGGGASCCVRYRGSAGSCPGQYISVSIGRGGTQGGSGNCRYGIQGAMYACVCTYERPRPSITASPLAFRLDGGDGNESRSKLTWSTSGGESDSEIIEALVNGSVVYNYGQQARNNSTGFYVSPEETTEFRLTTTNPAYEETDSVIVTVYIPPNITFTVTDDEEEPTSEDITIVLGEQRTLKWTITGDVDTVVITPGVGSSNNNSSTFIQPSTTTTYSITASGLGGVASKEIKVTVLQPPTLSVSGPINIDYEDDIIVSISATNSDGGVSYVSEYTYTSGQVVQIPGAIDVPNTIGDIIEVLSYTIPVTYNDYGPTNVKLTFTVDGYGFLDTSDIVDVAVYIDQSPDEITIPEIEDALINETPIISPGEDTTITLTITDIDIPVEIKADSPIQVEIDDDDNWRNIRRI